MKKYDTDKIDNQIFISSNASVGFLEDYEMFFSEIKDKEIKYLEIGILNGGSLMWAYDFFPNAKIYGVDINPCNVDNDRIKTMICNQMDSEGLKKIGEEYGEFDIIIDDASHLRRETENTFNCLWNYLKKGGWYVIEDWDCGFWLKQDLYLPSPILDIIPKKNELGIDQMLIKNGNVNGKAYFKKL